MILKKPIIHQGSSQQQTSTSAEQSMIEFKSINHGLGGAGTTLDARENSRCYQQANFNEQSYYLE
jgi:hypothetical protein